MFSAIIQSTRRLSCQAPCGADNRLGVRRLAAAFSPVDKKPNVCRAFLRFPFSHLSSLIFHLILIPLLLPGCSTLRAPTLHAALVEAVPQPNAMIETQIWQQAKPLHVRLTQTNGNSITTEIRAIQDGRSISILVSWPDQTETVMSRAWVRMKNDGPWKLETIANDRLWLLFPLAPKAPRDLYRPPAAAYDAWQWQAEWTDVSGYADDARLITKYYPGETPSDSRGVIYPNIAGKGYVEQSWVDDAGRAGTIARPEPDRLERNSVLPAAMANPEAQGGATDVRALGRYGKQNRQSKTVFTDQKGGHQPGYWFGEETEEERPGSYFVEFYRLLITPNDEEDYQLRPSGPHRFSIAIIDNKGGPQPYLSPPLSLILDGISQH